MLHLFYDGGADYMTSLKTIIKKIEDMELLLKFLIGDRISIFNESGETVIAGNDMTEFKSEIESNMKSIRSFIDSSLMLFWKEYAVSKYPRFFPVPFEIKRNTELMIKFVELKVGIFKDESYNKDTIDKLEELKQTLIAIRDDIISQIPENFPYKVDL